MCLMEMSLLASVLALQEKRMLPKRTNGSSEGDYKDMQWTGATHSRVWTRHEHVCDLPDES